VPSVQANNVRANATSMPADPPFGVGRWPVFSATVRNAADSTAVSTS
jgi:hypothetical protein